MEDPLKNVEHQEDNFSVYERGACAIERNLG